MKFKTLVLATTTALAIPACSQSSKHNSAAKAGDSASDQQVNLVINAYLAEVFLGNDDMRSIDSDSPTMQKFLMKLKDDIAPVDEAREKTVKKLGITLDEAREPFLDAAAQANLEFSRKGPRKFLSDSVPATDRSDETKYFEETAQADQIILTDLEQKIAPLDTHGDWVDAIDAARKYLKGQVDDLGGAHSDDNSAATADDHSHGAPAKR